ncbi:hypothetical protein FRUB_02123 [Fimbriiglobus ruber]|uniref:Uncharacterized protein n=1 Tax=Fimbriiglobus ruber TaxID=1908690 RepID=A0A225DWM0_9BACT|nr:hypothetical protein FRUB_02123 [Fimbriiglobus ruber]
MSPFGYDRLDLPPDLKLLQEETYKRLTALANKAPGYATKDEWKYLNDLQLSQRGLTERYHEQLIKDATDDRIEKALNDPLTASEVRGRRSSCCPDCGALTKPKSA